MKTDYSFMQIKKNASNIRSVLDFDELTPTLAFCFQLSALCFLPSAPLNILHFVLNPD